jgi:hypothetical protein
MNKKESALHYLSLGMSVIPVGKDKKPLIQWLEFQNRLPSTDEINEWFIKFNDPNIGIVTGKISNLFVVDVDSTEALIEVEKYIPDSLETPVVSTPRGGRHFYFRHIDGISNRANILEKVDVRTQGGFIVAPPSVNGNGKAWSWITGLDSTISDVPDSLVFILKKAFFNTLNKELINTNNIRDCDKPTSQNITNITECHILAREGNRDDAIFHAVNIMRKGGAKEDELFKYGIILANSCVPPFPEEEVIIKIKSAIARSDRKEKNIARDLRDWVLSLEGHFNITEYHKESQLVTKEQKHACQVEIGRLVKEGIIRKYGDKRGCYEPAKDEQETTIDIFSADATPLNIKFPLDVHDLVKIMPKNIIVLAGEVNSGKTAYLLNLAARNMTRMETVYFSSEMGKAELKERVRHFDFNIEAWRQVHFVEKASDFYKAIRPEGLNIIDYLEIHEEFYKVGKLIKDIFDKLTTGIAVIAIQKNKGLDEGLGGERSKEKARLYLSIEPGKLKIVKAKNWVNATMNPNDMTQEFKLAKGCRFKPEGTWKRTD